MSKLQKKPPSTSPTDSYPSGSLSERRKIPASEIEDVVKSAFEMEDFEQALEAMEDAPHWMQKTPEFQLTRATALASIGEDWEALHILRELERKNPRFLGVYIPFSNYI